MREPATVTLLEAMRTAEDRDRIAWNYAHGFADIFDIGIPTFREALARWDDWRWATAAVHFAFMARLSRHAHLPRARGRGGRAGAAGGGGDPHAAGARPTIQLP